MSHPCPTGTFEKRSGSPVCPPASRSLSRSSRDDAPAASGIEEEQYSMRYPKGLKKLAGVQKSRGTVSIGGGSFDRSWPEGCGGRFFVDDGIWTLQNVVLVMGGRSR
jgi:hypothetical protein